MLISLDVLGQIQNRCMTELDEIFAELGISQYLGIFIEHGFDTWDTILDITESDFDILGVKLGHRRKLQRKIANSRGLSSVQALLSPTRNTPVDDRQTDENKTSVSKTDSKDGYTGGSGKRKYRRHPKPDENAPERPPSAYVLFSNKMRLDLKGRPLSFTEIAKLVGENWQTLPPTEKETYESQALNMKGKYNSDLAEYKKTENYRKYTQYLHEFKEKQAGVNHVIADTSKRPKLEHRVSSGSSGPGSSADSQQGTDRPSESGMMNSAGSVHESSPSAGRRLSISQRLVTLPSITPKNGEVQADRAQGSPTDQSSKILPGYRYSIYATGQQQTLAWRDSRLLGNVSTQYQNVKVRNDRRVGRLNPPTGDAVQQGEMWLLGDQIPGIAFSPPPLLTSESTAGTTDSSSSSAHYMPRTPLEPPISAINPLKPHENQLPPIQSISLSPQSSVDVTYNSPAGISVLDVPPSRSLRGYPSSYQSQAGSKAAIDSALPARTVSPMDDEVLDPVSALLRADEIFSRTARNRPLP